MGATENIVGEFIKGKKDRITITSKFGLNPPPLVFQKSRSFNTIKKIVKAVPFVHRLVKSKIQSGVASDYSVENAGISLEKSLAELRSDHIDYYLLHEAGIADANVVELINFLQEKVREGKIGEFGIGSSYDKLNDDCARFDPAYKIFQFEHNIFNENLREIKNAEHKTLITHSVFQGLKIAETRLSKMDPIMIHNHSIELGAEPEDNSFLPGMLLFHSSILNPGGMTLFSSTKKSNITNNLKWLDHFNKQDPKGDKVDRFIKQLLNDR